MLAMAQPVHKGPMVYPLEFICMGKSQGVQTQFVRTSIIVGYLDGFHFACFEKPLI